MQDIRKKLCTVEVFIEQIFLRILESGNSDFLHKSRVRDWTQVLHPDERFQDFDMIW